ncbi:MAG: hypothetical protein ACI9P5_000365, partial [Saprospiraceae bacterium]
MHWINFYIAILFFLPSDYSTEKVDMYLNDTYNAKMLKKVNRLRSTGCFCGRKYMPATIPLKWNDTLYKSALGHAKEM